MHHAQQGCENYEEAGDLRCVEQHNLLCNCPAQAFDPATGEPKQSVEMEGWPRMERMTETFGATVGRALIESFWPSATTEGLSVVFNRCSQGCFDTLPLPCTLTGLCASRASMWVSSRHVQLSMSKSCEGWCTPPDLAQLSAREGISFLCQAGQRLQTLLHVYDILGPEMSHSWKTCRE